MFYNTYRSTKAAQREAAQQKLVGAGKNIVNPKERLINMQKRQKLKDLLITKFMNKYGIKNPEVILEEEITKFLQGEKLNDVDLQRLDQKIHRLLMNKKKQEELKGKLTQNLQNDPNAQNSSLPPIQSQQGHQQPQMQPNFREENVKETNAGNKPEACRGNSVQVGKHGKKIYKSPEEELAELEAEEEAAKPHFERLDFAAQGDEWNAIAQYNKKCYEMEQEEERIKNAAIKKRTKEDLDNQVKEKLKREYEDLLKEKEYDRIMEEHQKKLDEIEKKKAEELKKQVLREKANRDAQIKDEYVRKRIETLKEKKFDRNLIKHIQEEIEDAKQAAIESKKKANEALKKTIKENELNKIKQMEQLKREKEDDVRCQQEHAQVELKKELERKLYFKRIERNANNFMTGKAQAVLDKLKQEEKEEEEKQLYYTREKNRIDQEKEDEEARRRLQAKHDLRRYLDMQVAEKKKDAEFEKLLDDEQARIWKIDVKKYNDDEKKIEQTIRAMNKRNLDMVMEQVKARKNKNKNKMNSTEYAMNRETLEKAKAMLS